MKKVLIIILLIPFFITIIAYFVANSAPDYSEERLPIEDEATAETLTNLVQNYRHDMVEAVNNGGFGDIEHYLVNNHTYRNVRAYMKDLQNSFGTEMELLNQTIEGVSYYYLDDVIIYCVDANETVKVVEKGQEEVEELSLRYEFIKVDDEFKIESIVQTN